MNFDIHTEERTIYRCVDGQEFFSLKEAQTHNNVLQMAAKEQELAERLENAVESYINSQVDWTDRKRAQARAMLTPFFHWYQRWDREFIAPTIEVKHDPEPVKVEDVEVSISDVPVEDYAENSGDRDIPF